MCKIKLSTEMHSMQHDSERQRSSCCMKTDHWLLLQLLLVVNNSQRTMGRVGFTLPASNITNTSFLCYTDQRVYTFIKKRDKIKIRCVKHQLYPSSGLSSREKHKSTPARQLTLAGRSDPHSEQHLFIMSVRLGPSYRAQIRSRFT
ncbi:hypothetical protein AMECASPLE_021861 [Ameca splendens]|uniref:Uncharacterized protein n=1 Tax=Ameca splendens TaxID=208324 RepID=A0ABV1A0H1_9TELE